LTQNRKSAGIACGKLCGENGGRGPKLGFKSQGERRLLSRGYNISLLYTIKYVSDKGLS
jgi:hypothetical protein